MAKYIGSNYLGINELWMQFWWEVEMAELHRTKGLVGNCVLITGTR
jgi:hypothetical protein